MAERELDRVLAFWFETVGPERWFVRDAALDAIVRERFEGLIERFARGVPAAWEASPRGALAAVIVLDQLPRNAFRGEPRAYATDALAIATARRAIAGGLDSELSATERGFLYMPFQHSEDPGEQARSVELFATLDERSLDFARRHQAIIDRFGRFPHRNAVLGRASTPEEVEFLRQPRSSF